jgi:hypothetical protein
MSKLELFMFLILVLSIVVYPSHQASTLGERTLLKLSQSDISNLVSTPDPTKNVDPSNPSSHLSKILIPRVGMFFDLKTTGLPTYILCNSRDGEQYKSQKLHHLYTSSSSLAH